MSARPSTALRSAVVLGLLLATVHASSPSAAAVTAPAPHRPVLTGDPLTQAMPVSTLLHAGLTPDAAARLVVQRELVSLGVPRGALTGADGAGPAPACGLISSYTLSGFQHGFTLDAGDLDGDHRRDVIESHDSYDGKATTGHVTARDARTGRPLWSTSSDLTVKDPLHQIAVLAGVATRVGPRHAPGVLLLRLALSSTTAGAVSTETFDFQLTGLDGHGHQLWHREFSGTFIVTSTPATLTIVFKNFPAALVLGNFRAGAEDLVEHRLTTTATGLRSDLDRYALDSGALSSPYVGNPPSVLSPVTDLLLAGTLLDDVGTAPDQNGDGREDLYAVHVIAPAGPVSSSATTFDQVVVYRGDTGAPIWSGPLIPRGWWTSVTDAGVLTQPESRWHDLAVVSHDPVGFSPAGGQATDRADGRVFLLQGGTGSLAWALPGASVFPMWRYQGQHALGILSVTSAPTTSGSAAMTLDVDLRDGQGKPVATVSHALPVPANCQWFDYGVVPGLDLTHDTSPDLLITTHANTSGTRPLEGALWLDGATGKELDRAVSGVLSESLNGAGASRLVYVAHAHDDTYSVRRGDRVSTVLAKVVVPRTSSGSTWFDTVLGTGAVCADLITVAYTPSSPKAKTPDYREVQQLLGANGKPWWTLTEDLKHPLGVARPGVGAKDLC